MTTANFTNYDLISKICLKNQGLKKLFLEQKNIHVDQPDEIQQWLEIVSAINLELAEKVGKIEVLLKWYKIITAKQGYSEEQIVETEVKIIEILKELINIDLEAIDLDDDIEEEYQITADLDLTEESSDNFNLQENIDLDFHLNFTIDEETTVNLEAETTEEESIKLDLDFLPIQEEIEDITENQPIKLELDFVSIPEETPVETQINETEETGINLDFIPLEETEIEPEIKPEINYETASRAELIEQTNTQEDQETVNLFDEPVPLEAAEENVRIFAENEPITMEELQIVFNRISKLSMRYLGGTLTKNYFHSTQSDDLWSQKFQMNSKGQITVIGILSQEVTPQELITFKQWTSKFIKNCSTIINTFPMMVKKQNLLGRIGNS